MKIQLELSRHCIETELKRLHHHAMSRYFKTKGTDAEMEKKIERIGCALETLDFPMLRARFPDLAGGSDKMIIMQIDEGGKIKIQIDETTISPV